MSGVENVISQAGRRIGYYAPDDPEPGSESGRYLASKMGQPWLSGPSTDVWWCMCFVSMCFDLAGEINAIGGFSYNTDVTLNRMSNSVVPVAHAQRGDVVIFNWDSGPTDHVGIVEANLGNGWLQTIEGNTSPSNAGSQSAGNGVYRRQRNTSIAAVIRPSWSDDSAPSAEDSVDPLADNWWGRATTAALQKALGVYADGVISSQDESNEQFLVNGGSGWEWVSDAEGSATIEALQERLSPEFYQGEIDGIFGWKTAGALQWFLRKKGFNISADGYVGEDTMYALQWCIRNGSI